MNMIIGAAAMTPAVAITKAEAGFVTLPLTAIAPVPAAAAPMHGVAATPINPELFRLADELDDAMTTYLECSETARLADIAHKKWRQRNPEPRQPADQQGYSRVHAARVSQHYMRGQTVMKRLGLGPKKKAMIDATSAFRGTVRTFAMVNATTIDEVDFKVGVGLFKDDDRGTIARSVLLDMFRLKYP